MLGDAVQLPFAGDLFFSRMLEPADVPFRGMVIDDHDVRQAIAVDIAVSMPFQANRLVFLAAISLNERVLEISFPVVEQQIQLTVRLGVGAGDVEIAIAIEIAGHDGI
jgi:hypothetical protein